MSQNLDGLDSVIKQVVERMKKLNPNPESCPDEEMLAAYYEGNLTRDEAEKLEAHLAVCERCAEKIVLLSGREDSHCPATESFVTEQMIQKAKDLMRQPLARISVGKRIAQWFSAFRPIPTFATASVLTLLLVSIITLYTPGERHRMQPGITSFGIIAKAPSTDVTRGKDPVYKQTELQEGAVLRSGDRFRIKFELQEGAYAYLLAFNSQGHVANLLTQNAVSTHFKADPGVTYLVPRDDEWFELDDNTGIERIYLLISPSPIEGIDKKIEALTTSGIDEIASIFSGTTIQPFSFRHERL